MLDEIIKIVKEAGQIMLKAHDIRSKVENKEGRANFVTGYDVKVQSFLYRELAKLYPAAAFIGEEEEHDKKSDKSKAEYCFIIDPIDGTTNFILDNRHSAVSVALLYHGRLAAGIVYNPYLNEVFYAAKGTGAFLNDMPLYLNNLSLTRGLAAVGTCPYYRDRAEETFSLSRKLYDKALDIRRSGSAALDICYVAAGRFVLFFELLLSPWDYAAASLILTEAGGRISTTDRKDLPLTGGCSVIAATPAAFEEFFGL